MTATFHETEMAQRVRDFDWATTPLGPMDAWPQSLKVAVNIVLTTRFPAMLWWGPHLIQIYNDGYSHILGKRHPEALGRSGPDIWYDVWPVIKPLVDAVFLRGESTWNERSYLQTERNGNPEDAWFTWSYSPLYDESGKIAGLLDIAVEHTRQVLVERERDRYQEQREIEQRKVRSILESITDGFFALDRQWRFSYTNPQAERLLNREPNELIGRDIWEEYPGIAGSPFEAVYRRAMDESVSGSVTSYYSQHQRWYEVHAYPATDGISVYFRDVTERMEIEAALRKSEQQRLLALDGAELGAWHLDPRVLTLETDRRFRQIFGIDADAATYEEALAMVHPADLEAVRTEVALVTSKRCSAPYEMEHRVIHRDGSVRWLLAKGRTNVDASGELVSMDGTIADITTRKRLEEERQTLLAREQQARREAEEAGRMKDEFLATLSHELRTPLSAILGWSQILQRKLDKPDTLSEGLSTIERNARAQTQIIEDLLDMSRIISGKVSLQAQPIDLAMVLRAAIDTVRPTALAKNVEISYAEPLPDRHPITGDPNRLQQVFWNLLSNAAKFTPAGGVVRVEVSRAGDQWQVDVTDSGEGIRAEFLPFVFDRFRQADASTTRKHGGLGLGLAIVKQLTELHGGSVRAHSEGIGKGATFSVLLPSRVEPTVASTMSRLTALADASMADLKDAFGDGAQWQDSSCDDLENRRILVVDDESDARNLLHHLLSGCGAKVALAADADEAFEQIRRSRPEVMVSDLGMPGTDGYELMRRVRRLTPNEGGQTPSIALTAYARADDRVKAIRAGFDMHVPKPVEPAELITMIASLLARDSR